MCTTFHLIPSLCSVSPARFLRVERQKGLFKAEPRILLEDGMLFWV